MTTKPSKMGDSLVDVDERDEDGYTPLANALLNFDVKKCRELVRLGADLSKHASIDPDKVKNTYLSYMIARYVSLTSDNQTRLVYRLIYDIFNLLLTHGVDPNEATESCDEVGEIQPYALRCYINTYGGEHDIYVINRLFEAGTRLTHVTDEDDYVINEPFLLSLIVSNKNTVQMTFELDLIIANIHQN